MDAPIIAVVTGSNRGIGCAICAALVQQFSGPLILYAASRAGTSFDLTGLTIPPTAKIHPARLSLTDQATITALSTMVGKEHMGCDILINNAGIYYFQENITAVQRQETLDVNYRGTLNVDHRILFSFLPPTNHRQVCQAFLPIMRKNGRIVNLSSQSGQLKYFDPSLQKRFLYPDLTLTELDALVNEYSHLADQHTATASGWPPLAYFTSKAALNAATRILAHENPHLLINCCCPGWVGTSLGAQAGQPPKSIEEGARIPLRLAVGDIGKISGRYWANDSVASTGDGKVRNF
ncbi:Short-chain dehydrogenase/reductase SDR [Penicillium expansum]|uniref:Short-chain dehydrogenase/reductase SDR n=1 Tax=Penicillium expansum TaxID=27334 RepID=A0A0A2JFI5_PENEN|nr:Short-chain dehydrogenase/reductase SDR [Penicillium expansum]KGO53546.1 Short-chain dehydrogenase/reductase SDR [Penicillium expansum]